ncbi:MAG: hypothetical protein CL761_05570 [Chloroflexi bacterium]|nr:hypothetical protein [Chloroflexota bacterium]|tara:strand:- start:1759 stop:2640 length:882 start_codon:yes stop_codon:yes gene_type:complete
MTKPILHINAGVGWSATKPLCYTFDKVGYVHHNLSGDKSITEPHMLHYLYESKYNPVLAKSIWHNKQKHRKFDFIRKNTTLLWYIQYMKSKVKDSHRGVCDFSNSNGDLPDYFLKEIAPALEEEFDVRVTMIWRDPVRRSYSHLSAKYKKYKMSSEDHIEWQMIKKQYPDSISYWKSKLDRPEPFLVPDYIKNLNNWKSAFKKVYPVIMEEVWEDPSGLSDFIGMKIEKMHDNVYFPERGTKRPEIKGLRDQWSSDMQDLSNNDLQYGRNKLEWVYNNFQKEFGYIPQLWLKK